MDLETLRDVVVGNMPYRSGFMFLNGCRFYETEHYVMARYDLQAVPYIRYNEEGTRYTTKNKGFISQKTMGELIACNALDVKATGFSENAKRRALNIDCEILTPHYLNTIYNG